MMLLILIIYDNFNIGKNFKLFFALLRGGNYNNNTNAGVFNFNHVDGNTNINWSFRLVI